MRIIAPTLPERYSPIRAIGFGNQGVYLAQISKPMVLVVAQLASPELLGIIRGIQISEATETPLPELRGIVEWEEQEAEQISEDSHLRETEKLALIKGRRGQGLFRQNVGHMEHFCRTTRVDQPEHLIASHI
jgi:putative restriction endonuclease